MVHGLYGEEAPQDEKGMQTMRNLARNMVWMMRCFALGKKEGIPYPATKTEEVSENTKTQRRHFKIRQNPTTPFLQYK